MKPYYKNPSSKISGAEQVYNDQRASSPLGASPLNPDPHITPKEGGRCTSSVTTDPLSLSSHTIPEDENSIQDDLDALTAGYHISALSTRAASMEYHTEKAIQALNLLGTQLQKADKELTALHLTDKDHRNVHNHLYKARLYAFNTKLHVFFLQHFINGDSNYATCTQSYYWNDDDSDDGIYVYAGGRNGNAHTKKNSGNVCVALQELFDTAKCHSRKAEQTLGLAQYRIACARDTLTSKTSKLAEKNEWLKSVLDRLQVSEKYTSEAAIQLSGIAHGGVKKSTYNSAKRRSRTKRIATRLKTASLSLVITIIFAPFAAILVFFMLMAYMCAKTFMVPKIPVSSTSTESCRCIKQVGEWTCGLFFMLLLFPITLALSAAGSITAVFKMHIGIVEELHNRFTTNSEYSTTMEDLSSYDTVYTRDSLTSNSVSPLKEFKSTIVKIFSTISEELHNGFTTNSEYSTTTMEDLSSYDTVYTRDSLTSNSVSPLKECKSTVVNVVNISTRLTQLIRRKPEGNQPSTLEDENAGGGYAVFAEL